MLTSWKNTSREYDNCSNSTPAGTIRPNLGPKLKQRSQNRHCEHLCDLSWTTSQTKKLRWQWSTTTTYIVCMEHEESRGIGTQWADAPRKNSSGSGAYTTWNTVYLGTSTWRTTTFLKKTQYRDSHFIIGKKPNYQSHVCFEYMTGAFFILLHSITQ